MTYTDNNQSDRLIQSIGRQPMYQFEVGCYHIIINSGFHLILTVNRRLKTNLSCSNSHHGGVYILKNGRQKQDSTLPCQVFKAGKK